MKITEVSADGLGVSALIAAAGKIHDLTEERNIILGLLEDGGEGIPVGVVMAKSDRGNGYPLLAVTVEKNPRVLWLEGDVKPEPEHDTNGFRSHLVSGVCICVGPCCNDAEENCTCPECTEREHGSHGRVGG